MSAGALGKWMGIDAIRADSTGSEARMPVEGNTQPYGLLHGGATAALCETVGSVSAMLHAGPGKIAVGVDLNITHHRPVMDGYIVAKATAAHLGRTSAVYEIVVTTEEEGKRVATARLSCTIMPDPTA
ncbi:hotdog fold thioesterase [Natronoglycomyces albus]|uniref:Hotdog fold thioesterase n=2 Tax=Natronoglycomyces albus TaxID=2811108 RepID=A0A895XPF2_9ACTN|nr:hotdog fold thioesterase [Natronoglycomyces albus]